MNARAGNARAVTAHAVTSHAQVEFKINSNHFLETQTRAQWTRAPTSTRPRKVHDYIADLLTPRSVTKGMPVDPQGCY